MGYLMKSTDEILVLFRAAASLIVMVLALNLSVLATHYRRVSYVMFMFTFILQVMP